MTRTMTRSFTFTPPLHYNHARVDNFLKKGTSTPSLTHTLTRSLTHNFGSIQSAEMSVLTIVPADLKEKSFVHILSLFTTTAAACQKQAHFMTCTRSAACSL